MTTTGYLFSFIIILPILTGLLSLLWKSQKAVLKTMVCGILLACVPLAILILRAFADGPVYWLAQWLMIDALSAYHLGVMLLVFSLSSLYAWVYFGDELRRGRLRLSQAKLFTGLWCPTMSTMTLLLISNNLGIMWISLEATTLLTAFLIRVHLSRGVLEAVWKYILICSVGISFAFMGTLLLMLSTESLNMNPEIALLWTNLLTHAQLLNPALIKGAFVFLLVGFGTKAGLAPMHNWLPDAHSKAPAPVSALFSGFMLNAALYCIMRYVPIVNIATGSKGWPLHLLLGLGIASIIIAAAFILFQRDLKRLLAYHSVEHLGIIAIGLGLGGLGTFGALFHTLNHSLCKTLSFFAAGRLGQIFGSHDMERMSGGLHVSKIWGIAILASLLALIGVAPFSLFMSEFQILQAALDKDRLIVAIVFLIGTASVFVGALSHAMPLAWGTPRNPSKRTEGTCLEMIIVIAPLVILLGLGIWMPSSFKRALEAASAILGSPLGA